MNREHQTHPLVVLGLNVWMGTAAGADELEEVPYRGFRPGPKAVEHCTATKHVNLEQLATPTEAGLVSPHDARLALQRTGTLIPSPVQGLGESLKSSSETSLFLNL